jgi:hypothetical protein
VTKEVWEEEIKKPRRGIAEHSKAISYSNVAGRISSPSYQASITFKKPECVLKVASFARGAVVKTLLEYISRAGTDCEMDMIDNHGLHHKGKEAIQEIYKQWKGDFERKYKRSTRVPRHATHIILSAKTDGSQKEERKIAFAAQDFVDEALNQKGFEYVYALHNDTEHPHIHIVVKNYNQLTKKKLSLTKSITFDMRQAWAKCLSKNGIDASATLRRDRPDVLEGIVNGTGELKENKPWHEIQMEKASAGSDVSFHQRKIMIKKLKSLRDEIKLLEDISKSDAKTHQVKLKKLRKAVLHSDKKSILREVRLLRIGLPELPSIEKFFNQAFEDKRARGQLKKKRQKAINKHYAQTLKAASTKLIGKLDSTNENIVSKGLARQLKAVNRLLKFFGKAKRLQALAGNEKTVFRSNNRTR